MYVLIERTKFHFKCLQKWLFTEYNSKCFLLEFSKILLVCHRCIPTTEQNNKRKKTKTSTENIDQIDNKISFFLNLSLWSMLGSSSSSCHLTNEHDNGVPPLVGKITIHREIVEVEDWGRILTFMIDGESIRVISIVYSHRGLDRTSSVSSGSSV